MEGTKRFLLSGLMVFLVVLSATSCGAEEGADVSATATVPALETPATAEVLPTPTALPSPTPVVTVEPEAGDMDATLVPEVMRVAPGDTFTVTWRVRNAGTQAWGAGFRWVFVGGERMGAPSGVPIADAVEPGAEVEIELQLVAPTEPGEAEGWWRVHDATGRPLGPEFGVRIEVVAAAAEPPAEEPDEEAPPLVLEEGCLDSAPVADVTVPDGEVMEPGETFTKIWRIRNSGTCEWGPALGEFTWVFQEGHRMGGPAQVLIEETVAPGDEVDVALDLTAPEEPGQHRGVWWVHGPDGEPFGVPFWVLIEVPGSAPPLESSSPAAVADWPELAWQYINGARATQGVPQLGYNDLLALAAQGHADDCSQRGSCSHTGSDGSDVRTRVERVGYEGSVDESWAMSASPEAAVAWWLDEVPPDDLHRRMLLADYLAEVGLGVAPAEDGYYFVAVFGNRGR
jgi:hypothetical protein